MKGELFCKLSLSFLSVLVSSTLIACSNDESSIKTQEEKRKAQETESFTQAKLYLVKKDGRYGFINQKGQLMIPYLYKSAQNFSEGLAMVSKDGKHYGYIDTSGKVKIPLYLQNREGELPLYGGSNDQLDFNMGKVTYYDKKADSTGILTNKGQNLHSPKYNYDFIEEGYIFATDKKTNQQVVLDKNGKKVFTPKRGEVVRDIYKDYFAVTTVKEDDEQEEFEIVDLVDNHNKVIVDATEKKIIQWKYGNEGLIPYYTDDFFEGEGYVNDNGEIVIKARFDSASPFSEGMAVVGLTPEQAEDPYVRSGYINQTGEIVIPVIYDTATDFNEGVALVSKDNKYFFINKTGKKLFNQSFSDARNFQSGLALVKKGNKLQYINKKGKVVWGNVITNDKDLFADFINDAF
ncbi:WG repeat-containing protein [Pseudobacillus sp. FSL P4-0506]|uniref:WG repeat-containing protein n=1 Tax=Pseudobacillus sp. FSL P4-0506 TaxID=2921576 RepID=UPI0030FD1969